MIRRKVELSKAIRQRRINAAPWIPRQRGDDTLMVVRVKYFDLTSCPARKMIIFENIPVYRTGHTSAPPPGGVPVSGERLNSNGIG